MKKLLAILLAAAMLVALCAGCAKAPSDQTDSEYVKDKGTLIVGITDFAPMDYKENEADTEWIGFDADMAKAFAASLGVKCEFLLLTDWDAKTMELDNKNIDCVWNGMTLSSGVLAAMETSKPYCNNAQCVVVKAEKAAEYATKDAIAGLSFAAEDGSAGEEVLEGLNWNVTPVPAQSDALMEVAAGTSDAAVIDLLMAGAMIGDGTSYPDLAYTVLLSEEEYGVGFRKGSDLAELLNDFFAKAYADGSMMECARTYGVQESILAF